MVQISNIKFIENNKDVTLDVISNITFNIYHRNNCHGNFINIYKYNKNNIQAAHWSGDYTRFKVIHEHYHKV